MEMIIIAICKVPSHLLTTPASVLSAACWLNTECKWTLQQISAAQAAALELSPRPGLVLLMLLICDIRRRCRDRDVSSV